MPMPVHHAQPSAWFSVGVFCFVVNTPSAPALDYQAPVVLGSEKDMNLLDPATDI
jgi:hypothetical protein